MKYPNLIYVIAYLKGGCQHGLEFIGLRVTKRWLKGVGLKVIVHPVKRIIWFQFLYNIKLLLPLYFGSVS